MLNARGRALFSLLAQQQLLMLSGTMQLSHSATSLSGASPDSAQSVVDYAVASHPAAPWVMDVTVGKALSSLSDNCQLTLSLALLAPPALSVAAQPTLYAHWEPGT